MRTINSFEFEAMLAATASPDVLICAGPLEDMTSIQRDMAALQSKADSENRQLNSGETAQMESLYARFTVAEARLTIEDRTRTENPAEDYSRGTRAQQDQGSARTTGRRTTDAGQPGNRQDGPRRNEPTVLAKGDSFYSYAERNGLIRPREDHGSIGGYVAALVTGDWQRYYPQIKNSMEEGTPGLGGYLVPTPLSGRIIDLARAQSRVFQAGVSLVPMTSETLGFGKVTGDVVPEWLAEHEAATPSDPTFGKVTLTAKKVAAVARGSVEFFEDAVNAESLVEDLLAKAMAQEIDRVCLVGSGSGQEPLGIYNFPGVTIHSVGAALGSYNALSTIVGSVRQRNVEPGDFILHPRTVAELDRLTDQTDQPLLPPPSVRERQLLSTSIVPVNLGYGSPITSSDGTLIFTGLWPSLYLGMRTAMRIEVSRDADDAFLKHDVLIRIYSRLDVQLIRAGDFAVADQIKAQPNPIP